MKKILFKDIDKIFEDLDWFNDLWCYDLVITTNNKYNIYDEFSDYYVFDTDLDMIDLLEIWTEKALRYMKNEYLQEIPKNMLNELDYILAKKHNKKLKIMLKKLRGMRNE